MEKIWQLCAGLLTLKILSGYLAVSEFGMYQSAVAILAIATAATWLCPIETVVAKLDSNGDIPERLFQTVLILRGGISLLIYSFVAGITPLVYGLDIDRYIIVLILCFTVLHAEPIGFLRFRLESKGLIGRLSTVRLTTSITRLLAMLWCSKFNISSEVVIGLLVLEQAINSLAYYALYNLAVQPIKLDFRKFDLDLALDVLATGTKYWLGYVVMYCTLKFDRLYFSVQMSAGEFGIYSAGANMVEQVNSLALMFVAVTAPAMIYAKSKSESLKTMRSYVPAVVGVGLMASLAAYLLAPMLISYIFGNKYNSTVAVFKTLVLLSPLVYLDVATSLVIFKFEKARVFYLRAIIVFIVSTLGTVLLYPLLGWRCVVIAYGIGLVLSISISLRVYLQEMRKKIC